MKVAGRKLRELTLSAGVGSLQFPDPSGTLQLTLTVTAKKDTSPQSNNPVINKFSLSNESPVSTVAEL